MNIEFTESGYEDFTYWIKNDPDIVEKINDLLRSIKQNSFKGLGKPEPLKQNLRGYWSRRITDEHRLVYKVYGKKGVDQRCCIIQCRFHY